MKFILRIIVNYPHNHKERNQNEEEKNLSKFIVFKDWDKVSDYESDEQIVSLIDSKGNIIYEAIYPGFTLADLARYKNLLEIDL